MCSLDEVRILSSQHIGNFVFTEFWSKDKKFWPQLPPFHLKAAKTLRGSDDVAVFSFVYSLLSTQVFKNSLFKRAWQIERKQDYWDGNTESFIFWGRKCLNIRITTDTTHPSAPPAVCQAQREEKHKRVGTDRILLTVT